MFLNSKVFIVILVTFLGFWGKNQGVGVAPLGKITETAHVAF